MPRANLNCHWNRRSIKFPLRVRRTHWWLLRAGPAGSSADMPSVVYVAEAKFVDTLTPIEPPDDTNQNEETPETCS